MLIIIYSVEPEGWTSSSVKIHSVAYDVCGSFASLNPSLSFVFQTAVKTLRSVYIFGSEMLRETSYCAQYHMFGYSRDTRRKIRR